MWRTNRHLNLPDLRNLQQTMQANREATAALKRRMEEDEKKASELQAGLPERKLRLVEAQKKLHDLIYGKGYRKGYDNGY